MEISTLTGMPGSRRTTPLRTYQLHDAPMERMRKVAAARRTKVATLVAKLVLWWMRWPGAQMPKRPEPEEWQ